MQAWEEFLTFQEKRLGVETITKWLRTLEVLKFDACNLYLQASDSFQAMWFEEHIRPQATTKLVNNNHKRIKIHLSIANSAAPSSATSKQANKKNEAAEPENTFSLAFDQLDPYHSFDHFVKGKNNELCITVVSEVTGGLSNPSTPKLGTFNPIYLYGSQGVGKTHLLVATANVLRKRGLKVIYARAETFTEHVVSAIRTGEMQLFRKTYRHIDVLLIDDIQVFSGKAATQEEFFHTFNTLHIEGKQIILAANCVPQELKAIEPRLISRFEWGIVLPVAPLNREEMREALIQRGTFLKFPLQEKVIEFILTQFGSNTKTALRALEALILRTHLNESSGRAPRLPLSLEVAETYLSELLKEQQKNILTPQKIIQTTAEYYGIRPEDVLSKSQSRDCALPRQIAMHLCRSQLGIPFKKIGTIFSRDHSTVMSSIKQIQQSVDSKNPEVAGSVATILRKATS